jgi:hypothetical protein
MPLRVYDTHGTFRKPAGEALPSSGVLVSTFPEHRAYPFWYCLVLQTHILNDLTVFVSATRSLHRIPNPKAPLLQILMREESPKMRFLRGWTACTQIPLVSMEATETVTSGLTSCLQYP